MGKMTELITATKALDEQYQMKDKATKAADAGAKAMDQGIELLIMKATEADGKYHITEQAMNKYAELNEKYQLSDKAKRAKEKAKVAIEEGTNLLQDKKKDFCQCQ